MMSKTEKSLKKDAQIWGLKVHKDQGGLVSTQKLKFLCEKTLIACCQKKTVLKLIDSNTGQILDHIFDAENNQYFKEFLSDSIRSMDVGININNNPEIYCSMESGRFIKLLYDGTFLISNTSDCAYVSNPY